MQDLTPAREGEIEGRRILVFDDLVSMDDVRAMTAALDRRPFTRTETATPDTAQFKHWVCELSLEATQRLPIYAPAMDTANLFAPNVSYRMYRSYCNHAGYGDVLCIHTDAQPGARELTALWFLANEWDPDWGGETLFFNTALDAEFVVSPRPGRLVIFDGSIPHAGRPPSRACPAPRYSFAMKFEVVAQAGV